MRADMTIERTFERELESLPLPPEDKWVPTRRPSAALTFGIGIATVGLVAVLATGIAIRSSDGAGSAEARNTPPARPTCVDGGRVCLEPVPNLYYQPQFGYSVVTPGWMRPIDSPESTLQVTGLTNRVRFTARTPEQDVAAVARYGHVPPWDFVVEVYDNPTVGVMERARLDGCGAGCSLSETKIRQAPTVVASWSAGDEQIRAYYVDRGTRLVVFKYAVGPIAEQPAGINEVTLQRIIDQVGLP